MKISTTHDTRCWMLGLQPLESKPEAVGGLRLEAKDKGKGQKVKAESSQQMMDTRMIIADCVLLISGCRLLNISPVSLVTVYLLPSTGNHQTVPCVIRRSNKFTVTILLTFVF